MPRFTVKKVPHPAGGYYYSVRRDGREIGGHLHKIDAQAMMHSAKRKYRLKAKK